jgi:hypothetical protein
MNHRAMTHRAIPRITAAAVAVLASGAAWSDPPPSIDPLNHQWTAGVITGTAGVLAYYEVGKVHICGGYGWVNTPGDAINWGDGTQGTSPPNTPTPLPDTHDGVGAFHEYLKPGVYHLTWSLTAACAKDATSTGYVYQWSDTTPVPGQPAATATAYIFSPTSSVAALTCPPVNVNQTVSCKVTVAPAPGAGGVIVNVVAGDTTVISVPTQFRISGAASGTFKIKGGSTHGAQTTLAVATGFGTPVQSLTVTVN